jgi:hypothetical protein
MIGCKKEDTSFHLGETIAEWDQSIVILLQVDFFGRLTGLEVQAFPKITYLD